MFHDQAYPSQYSRTTLQKYGEGQKNPPPHQSICLQEPLSNSFKTLNNIIIGIDAYIQYKLHKGRLFFFPQNIFVIPSSIQVGIRAPHCRPGKWQGIMGGQQRPNMLEICRSWITFSKGHVFVGDEYLHKGDMSYQLEKKISFVGKSLYVQSYALERKGEKKNLALPRSLKHRETTQNSMEKHGALLVVRWTKRTSFWFHNSKPSYNPKKK